MNLLFDFDGTLTDPLAAIRASLQSAFVECGLPAPKDDTIPLCIGPPLHDSLRGILSVPEELVEKVITAYRAHQVQTAFPLYTIYPGTAACLKSLFGNHRLFVATSKLQENAAQLLQRNQLSGYFEQVYGSRLDGELSFKPDLIRHLLQQEQLPAKGTWMIGDRRHDIEGAKANGIGSIAVLWGFGNRKEFLDAGADHVVADWSGFLALLPTLD